MAARRRFRWGFAALGLVVVIAAGWALTHHKKPSADKKPPVVAVTTAKVAIQDVALSVSNLGAAQAWQSVVIRPQVSGKLLAAPVREGSDVAAGDLLAQIDPAPFHAALVQAQGALTRDQALLQNARLDLTRYQGLAAQDSIAHQQVDTQAALVKQYEGVVAIDQGAVETAKINLGYCRITAPLSGRVGVRLVDPGNQVSATDTTGLMTLNQITPIGVTFSVPQGDFQRLSDASNGFRKALNVTALSQETSAVLGTGELGIADNHVDPTNGAVQMKARFPNPDRRIWPGQFVNVKLVLQTLKQAVTIPLVAVNQGPKGAFVYVVGPDQKALMRPVVVETVQDTVAVIKTGLKAGETVITDGQMTLKPGMQVKARPPNAPGARKPA
jgi:membrane fusion protein, multidrug efflux system